MKPLATPGTAMWQSAFPRWVMARPACLATVVGPDLLFRMDTPAFRAWRTVFVAITVQGLPFLLFGTLVTAAISAFVPDSVFNRVLPRNPPTPHNERRLCGPSRSWAGLPRRPRSKPQPP